MLKVDLAVIPIVSVMYLFCFIDRANIGQLHLVCKLVKGGLD